MKHLVLGILGVFFLFVLSCEKDAPTSVSQSEKETIIEPQTSAPIILPAPEAIAPVVEPLTPEIIDPPWWSYPTIGFGSGGGLRRPRIMPTCIDGILNQDETDIDCGGPNCDGCDAGERCLIGSDCQSLSCQGGTCVAPSCSDGIQNQDETGIDCGGLVCGACDGSPCSDNSECASGFCFNGQCATPELTCFDDIQNQSESDVDCGGPNCSPCRDGSTCVTGSDCLGGVCATNFCFTSSCNDGTLNLEETDIDCGGSICAPCANGSNCSVGTDCESGFCNAGTCAACGPGSTQACGSDVGECVAGMQTCVGGIFGACVGDTGPATEVCDNLDNDCDGITDEGTTYFADDDGDGFGSVADTTNSCEPTPPAGFVSVAGDCNDAAPAINPSATEICADSIDNDCDGSIDESCVCTPGATMMCGTNLGSCSSGQQTCSATGAWGACSGATAPQIEMCNAVDDDCDGALDEDTTRPCSTICGSTGTQVCTAGAFGACMPPAEDCSNSVDDDCDGMVNEGCP